VLVVFFTVAFFADLVEVDFFVEAAAVFFTGADVAVFFDVADLRVTDPVTRFAAAAVRPAIVFAVDRAMDARPPK
jgi:hypothetical protein